MRNLKVDIVRSARKTLSIQIQPDGSILARAPRRMSQREIQAFLEAKADWIEKHLAIVERNRTLAESAALSPEDIQALARQAAREIPDRVRLFGAQMGVTYGRITIRNQTTRWGSCSGAGNLNFNCLLMLAPEAVRDYVIVHELAHRKQMNHSAAFWKEVEAVLPDYRERRSWLKQNGGALRERMRQGREK